METEPSNSELKTWRFEFCVRRRAHYQLPFEQHLIQGGTLSYSCWKGYTKICCSDQQRAQMGRA